MGDTSVSKDGDTWIAEDLVDAASSALRPLSPDPHEAGILEHLTGRGSLLRADLRSRFAFAHPCVSGWLVARYAMGELRAERVPTVLAARPLLPLVAEFFAALSGRERADSWARGLAERSAEPLNLAQSNAVRLLRQLGDPRAVLNLAGRNLRGRDLAWQSLRGADLRQADLTGARLARADLTGARLDGARLLRADLTGAVLRDASLEGADLTQARLGGADLSGASLKDAVLHEAKLQRVFRDRFKDGRTQGPSMVWLLGEYAWYGQLSGFGTHPVGEKRPNAWELYDVHGNVWEWGQDAWHFDYSGAPSDGSAWTDGGTGAVRVIRGGSWVGLARLCRSAFRLRDLPDSRFNALGFRCARAQA